MNKDNGNSPLTEEDKICLKNWSEKFSERSKEKGEENASIKSLFNHKNRYLTSILWIIWFFTMFNYYGITIFTPYILEKSTLYVEIGSLQGVDNNGMFYSNKKFGDITMLIFSCFCEVFAVFIAAFFIENKSFGRKYSLMFFCFLTSLSIFNKCIFNYINC